MQSGAHRMRGKVWLGAAVAAAAGSGGAAGWWGLSDYKVELTHGIVCTVSKDAWPSSETVLKRGLASEAEACKTLSAQLKACGTVDGAAVQRCKKAAPGTFGVLEDASHRVVAVPFSRDHRALGAWALPSWMYRAADVLSRSDLDCGLEPKRVSEVFQLVQRDGSTCLAALVENNSLVTAAHCLDLRAKPSEIGISCRSSNGAASTVAQCRWPQAPGEVIDERLDIAVCTFDPAKVAACAMTSTHRLQKVYPTVPKLQGTMVEVLNSGNQGTCLKLNRSSSVTWPDKQSVPPDNIFAGGFGSNLSFTGGDSGGVVLADLAGVTTIVGINTKGGSTAVVVPTWADACLWNSPPGC